MMRWYKLPARCHEDAFVSGLRRATWLAQSLARELRVTYSDGANVPIDRESDMNRDQIKGVAQQVKGKVNEVVGKVTGNRTQQLKGDLQQATGTARKAFGDGKEKIRRMGR
ncbi:general stress protein CsbD (plasmid) [Paraburkholderia caribensis MBA4]|uniref:General stress protein CsbD n=1 Tax=Paraburkholderia caribensis MBA4 TaxID=1323664 RepID=A0A0P0RNZ1_9BURK|nr:general stress protein CsbD [Paraburkholderia caribensis MBA4]